MNYYIADLHFGHDNIIRFCKRPFSNADEMDRCLLEAWNERVTASDDIFIVGDLIYRSKMDYSYYLNRLNGHKHLITGNHDLKLIKDENAAAMLESVDQILNLTDGEDNLCLCHYPIADWPGRERGRKHFFGHIHNRVNEISEFMSSTGGAFNVGVDIIGPMPMTAKEILSGCSTSWNR